MAKNSGRTLAGGKVAPNNSPNATGKGSGHGGGGFSAGNPSKPTGKHSGFGMMKSGPYPTPVRGGGMAGSADKGGNMSAITAHPMSRKPKAR